MEKEVSVMELIVSHQSHRGTGKHENSPIRIITQVFSKEGTLIAENDPLGNYTLEDMISFAQYYANPAKGKNVIIAKDIEDWKTNPR